MKEIKSLNYIIKKIGKRNFIDYVNKYHTERINHSTTIKTILHVLWVYSYEEMILNHINNHRGNSDLFKYGIY